MKIAVPTSDGKNISKHVALSKYFYIFDIGSKILVDKIENPIIDHLKESNVKDQMENKHMGAGRIIPGLLMGINVFLGRDIGLGMKRNLENIGIQCIETEEKNIGLAIDKLLKGGLL